MHHDDNDLSRDPSFAALVEQLGARAAQAVRRFRASAPYERLQRLANRVAGAPLTRRATPLAAPPSPSSAHAASGPAQRAHWVALAERLATPVLTHLAARTLSASMPVEVRGGAADPRRVAWRRRYTHLEAGGRLLAGLAPWLELGGSGRAESALVARLADDARAAIASLADPASPDRIPHPSAGRQPLVDLAFLSLALLRAPRALAQTLPSSVRANLVAALVASRAHRPHANNWLLFPALVEAALCELDGPWDPAPAALVADRFERWYVGDGVYGDGPTFAWSYYNSYVIHPMLLELGAVLGPRGHWPSDLIARHRARATRYSEVLERLIAPDGSFPAVGRSIAYRAGAFHGLALQALHRALPFTLTPAQVRCALTAVLARTLDARDTFDAQGWLQIGLAGHQLDLGEVYVSTGSLYMASLALLPLGLPVEDELWAAPAADWTGRRLWSGAPGRRDAALEPYVEGDP